MSTTRRPMTMRRRIAIPLVSVFALLVTLAPPPAHAAVAVTTGGPFTYVEQDPPLTIGTGTSVTGGNFYDGQFVDFEITGATSDEHLALQSVATPSTADGVVSVVGTAVYVGDGSAAVPIGSIDAVNDGAAGTKLRVNFGSDFRNAGFETGSVSPWTAVEDRIELGVTSIAGFVADDTASYPPASGGDGDAPISATYSVFTTSANPPGATEGSFALGLTSNMTTQFSCDVVHGPAVYSAPFDAVVGQTLTFDWRAFAGADAYAVFGYLLNTSSGAQTEVLDAFSTSVSGTTAWATVNVNVPATGTYRFVFVSGTSDATCGRAAGASLYVDNFQVVSADLVNDAMVSSVAELLTYEHRGDDPPSQRSVVVTAQSVADGTDSGTIVVNITPVNDPPVGSAESASWTNTTADDTFADITGTMSFSDPDNTTLSYSIDGGTPGSYVVSTVSYDHRLVGTYGTLYVDGTTGAYRIVADDPAIEATTSPDSEVFSVIASDGSTTGSAAINLGIVLPPAPRNVAGTPGDEQVAVTWDQPIDATGVTGYVVTASPGGATCTTSSLTDTDCTVTGLTNGVAYTFIVTTVIGSTSGTASLPSAPVTPVGPPGAPTAVSATPGDGRVLVSWSPPTDDGGAAITGYTVSASPGGGSCSTAGATSCTIIGLATGTTYTLTVTATNANGTSPDSDPVLATIKGSSSTSLSASSTDIVVGDSVTLTATVTGTSPTGSVEFFDGSTSLGSATLSGGTATLTTSDLAAGTRSVTAAYGGDDDNYASSSSAVSVTVSTVATVGITAVPDPAAEGGAVTLTATVVGNGPTGSVEFFDGSVSLGTASVSGGTAVLSTSSLPIGERSLTAVYGGDTLNTTATSAPLALMVLPRAVVELTPSSTVVVVGDELTLEASVTGDSPSGTVEFFDGTTSLGTASITGGSAELDTTALSVGTHELTAVYSGDSSNAGAESTVVEVTVVDAPTAAVDRINPAPGDDVVVTGEGFEPDSEVEIWLATDPATLLGTFAVGSDGTFSVTVDIPEGVEGDPNLEVRGSDGAGNPTTVVIALDIGEGLPATGSDMRTVLAYGTAFFALGWLLLLSDRARRRHHLLHGP